MHALVVEGKPAKVHLERARSELTSDLRRLVRDGMLLPVEQIPDELAPAISSIEVLTKDAGEGEMRHLAKIRLWDKNAALKLLFQLRGHGAINERQVNLKGDPRVSAQRQREREMLRYGTDEEVEALARHHAAMGAIMATIEARYMAAHGGGA